jgi:hypothetical protein
VRSAALARLGVAAIISAAALTMSAAAPASAAPPAPTLLTGVWCASAANCLAVGGTDETNTEFSAAHPLAERWNGKTWRTVPVRLPARASFGSLLRLACLSATWCVAVGYYAKGGVYHELADFWNGKAWTPTEPPAPGGGKETHLIDVSCRSARNCVSVGLADNGTGVRGIVEKWNGAKWARVIVPEPGDFSDMSSVSCPTAKFCVAVGGTFGGVLVESWNGTAWRRVSAPPHGALSTLTSVSCVSPSDCVAVGDADISSSGSGFAETWNGKAWATARVPWPKGTMSSLLIAVSCASRSYCAAVGNIGQDLASAANAGRPAVFRWNGGAWALQPVPALAKGKAGAFSDIFCRSAASCAAVGTIGPAGSVSASGLSGFWNGKTWKLVLAI